jgi:hypothetical protein
MTSEQVTLKLLDAKYRASRPEADPISNIEPISGK